MRPRGLLLLDPVHTALEEWREQKECRSRSNRNPADLAIDFDVDRFGSRDVADIPAMPERTVSHTNTPAGSLQALRARVWLE